MKKFISLLLVVTIVMTFAGCKGDETSVETAEPTSETQDSADELAFFNETIKFIQPYGAGGTADTVSRQFANMAAKYIKEPLVVVNVTGADGIVAATQFAKEPADTKQIMFIDLGIYSAMKIKKGLSFKEDDFELVSNLFTVPWILYVRKDSDFKTMEDLIEYGKTNTIKYSVGGIGTDGHLTAGSLFESAQVQSSPVIFDGGFEQISALLGGHVDAFVGTPSIGKQYIDSGELIPILTFGKTPYVGFDDIEVQSVVDFGYPDSAISGGSMIAVRKGADQATIDAVKALSEMVLADSEYQSWEESAGIEPKPLYGQELVDYVFEQVENSVKGAEILGLLEE